MMYEYRFFENSLGSKSIWSLMFSNFVIIYLTKFKLCLSKYFYDRWLILYKCFRVQKIRKC